MALIWRFIGDDSAATAIEYGMIAALVAVGCITAFVAFGDGLLKLFEYVRDKTVDAVANSNSN